MRRTRRRGLAAVRRRARAQPAASPNSRPEPIALGRPAALPWPSHGQAAVVIAGQTGTLRVYGKQRPVPIASVTKVMTALVILRDAGWALMSYACVDDGRRLRPRDRSLESHVLGKPVRVIRRRPRRKRTCQAGTSPRAHPVRSTSPAATALLSQLTATAALPVLAELVSVHPSSG
ncbi:hypothetical protein [Nonomuraea sp. NPDC046570]|uniref:hypothetical protein n=1 Tax=Nonomuraea sp. NPDC046570 TaxID=3155255 RepID=UPI0033DCF454